MRDMRHPGNGPSSVAREGAGCTVRVTPEQVEHRGMAWLIGAFLICPCHLPLTLWLAATLLAGTALGAALRGHPMVAGTVITLAWLAATWRGVHLLRSARAYAARARESRTSAGPSPIESGRTHVEPEEFDGGASARRTRR